MIVSIRDFRPWLSTPDGAILPVGGLILCPAPEVIMSNDVRLESLEVLPVEECVALLTRHHIGRVGFVVDGWPQVLPINYSADTDGGVIFRTTDTSILCAVAGQAAAFEIDGAVEQDRTGWSVCVRGLGHELADGDDRVLQRVGERTLITWAPGRRDRWFLITPAEITGRRIPLPVAPSELGWFPGIVG